MNTIKELRQRLADAERAKAALEYTIGLQSKEKETLLEQLNNMQQYGHNLEEQAKTAQNQIEWYKEYINSTQREVFFTAFGIMVTIIRKKIVQIVRQVIFFIRNIKLTGRSKKE